MNFINLTTDGLSIVVSIANIASFEALTDGKTLVTLNFGKAFRVDQGVDAISSLILDATESLTLSTVDVPVASSN